ncbi:MAG TPA: DASS family sodium-coupled anion symporter [Gaiellaceae bacterium]|nr:DASS family sodium-coupled anion symporter [Gaiellaceae bacterium]
MQSSRTTERLREPGEHSRRPFRPWILAIAVGAAALGAFLAPEDWPTGSGSVHVEYQERTVVDALVEIGESEPVTVSGRRGDIRIMVDFEDGIPVDERIAASIRVTRLGQPIAPEVEDIELELVLPDDRVELLPIVAEYEQTLELEATRHPPVGAAVVLALLGLVVVLWVSELFPLFVTSLLVPVVLVVAGVTGATEATAPFFNPIIVLFFSGFMLAEAMRRHRLDHLAAIAIVARAGRGPVVLFASMIGVAAGLSMFMSNTAAVAVLVPIALAVTAPLHHLGYRKALVLGIAYAATIGGVGSAIGTPANVLAIEFLDEFGDRSISFAEWFAFGLPMVLLFLPLMGVYLWWRAGVDIGHEGFVEARAAAQVELAHIRRPDRAQWTIIAVFVGIVVGWLTQTVHDVHPGIVALAGVVVLAMIGLVGADDLRRISWESLLTFGGGLALGLALVETGTSDWVATQLADFSGAPSFLAVAAVALLTLALTTVASNTASAAILIPLAIPLAGVLGVDPTLLVVVVAIASSIDFALVIGTPPTMLAYSTNLYTAHQIFRVGIVLDLLGLTLLVTVVVWIWELLGLV